MYNKNGIFYFLLFIFLWLSTQAFSQHQSKACETYIENHKYLAIFHMLKYKIPASITLAQGLLETSAGMSKLATKGNNYFGIKCHKDWKGDSMSFTDDAPNECFRKYNTVEDSYYDHSIFLTKRGRYAFLFNLEITDYKGWAKGLQEAGYATDKGYANKLIKFIEDYDLYQYDDKNYLASNSETEKENKKEKKKEKENKPTVVKKPGRTFSYNIFKTPSGLLYVEAKAGDSYETVADALGFKDKDLVKYNDAPKNIYFPLNKGDVVYLEKKKKKAEIPCYYHIVVPGESMYSIAQLYGIRLKNLYKMNKKNGDYIPEDGDQLKVR
ncbi:MAG: glucosaminidase domain-containing protein [Candidatus Azobacteroides sp.]|nr:glucosaminidase domain-containing protein [Candidatus Azobacteroides sp.]